MESHTESVAEATEESNVEALPDVSSSDSFAGAIEKAFSDLDETASQIVDETPEPTPEPEPEPAPEPEPELEPEPEPVVDDAEPVESLSEDIGDDWTPKAANRFKKLKSELKHSNSELEVALQKQEEYESKIQELTGLAENKDVEQLQEKLANYEQQQMFNNLENTEAYKEAIITPLVALMEQADQLADKYDVDPDSLEEVLSLDDDQEQENQLLEMFPTASERDKAKLFRIIEDIDPIVARRHELQENAEQALAEAKLVEEEKIKQDAAEKASLRQNVTRNVVERVQAKLPFLAGIEGLDMSEIQQNASNVDPQVLHPVDHAYNAVTAQLMPSVIREYVSMRKEVETLTDRLAEYESVEPKMSGQSSSNASPSSRNDGMSFAQSIEAALGSA